MRSWMGSSRSISLGSDPRIPVRSTGEAGAQVCTYVRLWECGWEDLRDGCAAFLVFHVGSARTLMGKGVPPMVGERW